MGDEAGSFGEGVAAVRRGADPHVEAGHLYGLLTDDERLGLLDGDTPFWQGMAEMGAGYNARPYVHGEVARLGIPGLRFVDGPRGCVTGEGTAFPVSMARGATWDPALEERVGDAIGREVRAQGGSFFGGVCVNLPRHPAWGRIQETYGDDPHHLGEMGAALARGTSRHVVACAKHLALNSMENARFHVDVSCPEDVLHEVYLPHFRRVTSGGADAVMSAYNSVNGAWCGQNRDLLTGVLREAWGWDGVVVSDFVWGLRDAAASLEAGLDVEEPFAQQRARDLRAALDDGRTSWDAVRRSGIRSLVVQLRSHAGRTPDDPPAAVMACPEHRALAREVAGRAMVLLANAPVGGTPVLPLDPAALGSLAVVGRLADVANTGDHGSSDVHCPDVVTPLAGLRAALPGTRIDVAGTDDPQEAALVAAGAEVAVVVVGYDARDEGEYVGGDTMADPGLLALFPPPPPGVDAPALGDAVMTDGFGGDRADLHLRPADAAVVRAVAAANPRTVVVLVAAGAVLCEEWRHEVPAVLLAWYPGAEGGHALADVLTGAVDAAGRLPFAVPASPEHLPPFDRTARAVTYDRWHGQHLLDRLGAAPAFPHGFGLSYTTFRIGGAAAGPVADGVVTVTVRVRNTGARDGRHVVQVYGRRADGLRPEALLCGFASVPVPAGAQVEVPVRVDLHALGAWDAAAGDLDVPAGRVDLEIGAYARDPGAVALTVGG